MARAIGFIRGDAPVGQAKVYKSVSEYENEIKVETLKDKLSDLKKKLEEISSYRTCTIHEIGKCPSVGETVYLRAYEGKIIIEELEKAFKIDSTSPKATIDYSPLDEDVLVSYELGHRHLKLVLRTRNTKHATWVGFDSISGEYTDNLDNVLAHSFLEEWFKAYKFQLMISEVEKGFQNETERFH